MAVKLVMLKSGEDIIADVKEIKSNAINEIFKNDLKNLDEDSRETLDKVVNYMEKKYISIPMLMAKDILIKKSLK